jgi:hypothetical protein
MDVESGKYTTNGKLYISIEMLPLETVSLQPLLSRFFSSDSAHFNLVQAEASPVGIGRSEPNQSPYLPAPAGRMKIGLDPCGILCAFFSVYVCTSRVPCYLHA